MKNGQIEEHEKKVCVSLNEYFDKILLDSGCIGTMIEMGKDGEAKKWNFLPEGMSGAFMFVHEEIEVYATPYWEYSEGVAYAVYENGEPFLHNLEHVAGTIPIIVTGNSQVDFEAYIGLVDDLLEKYNL